MAETQAGLRLLALLIAVLVGALIWIRPENSVPKGAVPVAVLLGVYGLRRAWRTFLARRGGGRCHLRPDGLVVTGPSGRIRDGVSWANVTGIKRMSSADLLMCFHRFGIGRRGTSPLVLVALGAQPPLVAALEAEAARNGLRG
ncbi:hypothetical protein ACIQ9E_06105 [Streptomyces sp. NPDC094448]|uniref:hypothetical protein n=1 Tax=Streptomyces sp. NPDC094448 TaxID=3366063 RepID=UPI0037FBC4A3